MDWDDLRFLLAIAREGSLSRAATRLRVTQPTVGRRIAAFEEELGARLLLPTPTGQQLTETGERLVQHVEQMERSALAAERVATGRDTGLVGTVRVTASEWVVGSVLVPIVEPFLSRNPGLELELVAEGRHVSLPRREADIALRASRFRDRSVAQRSLGTIAFGMYASDSYLAQHGTPSSENGCEGHTLIAMTRDLDKVPELDWLKDVASRARVVARSNGREPMARLAAAGVGLAFLPRFLGDRTGGLRRLHELALPPTRELWMGVHRDSRAIPRLVATMEFLSEAVRRLQRALNPA
jgi:DNA-binding transcriptional LysR family regulator